MNDTRDRLRQSTKIHRASSNDTGLDEHRIEVFEQSSPWQSALTPPLAISSQIETFRDSNPDYPSDNQVCRTARGKAHGSLAHAFPQQAAHRNTRLGTLLVIAYAQTLQVLPNYVYTTIGSYIDFSTSAS
jgi:hypothetical protein